MKNTDKLWIDIWSKEKYKSIGEVSTKEDMPVCFASFAHAMGVYFKENMKILDYGCGPARFCNFMSQRLENVEYYGVEPNSTYGNSVMEDAKAFYGQDKRVQLGFIGEDIERKAMGKVDVVLLISIFTHLTIEQTRDIIRKLYSVVERGGAIVFSVILKDKYELCGQRAYSLADAYKVVFNASEQIEDLAREFNCSIRLQDEWLHVNEWMHSIYKITNV